MTEQLFAFLSSLSHEDRADYFSGKCKVYEITYPYADANGEVFSQEFDTILARNTAEARTIAKTVGNNLNFRKHGWNGYVGVKEVR